MLVHRRARRRVLVRALLAAAERRALERGQDAAGARTVSGSDAERLYHGKAGSVAGEIPDYALWPNGTPCPTTIFFKSLDQK